MSDQQNNMYLDEQEQEQIRAEVPALAKAIDSGSPAAGAWLASWRAKKENPDKTPNPPKQPIQIVESGQSIADLRLENFKIANGRLSTSKSQLPNLAVQARIFEPVTPGRRKFFKEWREIPVIGRNDIKVEHKFHQLNQLDLTGWLMLIKFAGPDLISAFTRYEFLKAMKKQDSSRDYKWLRAFIDRINTSPFCITLFHNDNSWEKYRGPLAPEDYERSDGKFAVRLSKPLAAMFGLDGWSYINIEQRLELGQNQWAQAFHAWASTHTCPTNGFWFKKDGLWKEWGAGYKEQKIFLNRFKARILKPLHEIGFIKKVVEKNSAIGLWW